MKTIRISYDSFTIKREVCVDLKSGYFQFPAFPVTRWRESAIGFRVSISFPFVRFQGEVHINVRFCYVMRKVFPRCSAERLGMSI
jgi:hypothetical protein